MQITAVVKNDYYFYVILSRYILSNALTGNEFNRDTLELNLGV